MNLYILVEGEKTEIKMYPAFLSYILPELNQINLYQEAIGRTNSYYLMSGGGIPSIYNHLINAIVDINATNCYNYLLLCLDSEEISAVDRIKEVHDYIKKRNISLGNCILTVMVQNPCVETWFLGNQSMYVPAPTTQKFQEYSSYYNVCDSDPELMDKYTFKVKAHFHEKYLKEMLREKSNTIPYSLGTLKPKYSKENPDFVIQKLYFEELINRINNTPHCNSFREFISFCMKIKGQL